MQFLHTFWSAFPILIAIAPFAAGQATLPKPRLDAFDVGTVGSEGEVRLRAEGVPQIGEPWSGRVLCGPPGAPACLLFGLGELPLSLPQYGGTWYVQLPGNVLPFKFDLEGRSPQFIVNAALSTSFAGLTYIAQAFVLDPLSQGGVTLSNPLRVTFGNAPLPATPFLYINENDSGPSGNAVIGYSVASDGTLTTIPGSPFATGGIGLGSRDSIAATPDRNHLFVMNVISMDLASLLVQPDGSLIPAPGSPFPTGSVGPQSVEAVNGTVYVNHADGTIVGHEVNADGTLAIIGSWQVAAGNNVELVAGRNVDRLYALSNNLLWAFDIQPDGTLVQTAGPSNTSGGVNFGIEIAPDDSHVYVTNFGSAGIGIGVYRVLADGSVEWTGKVFPAYLPTVGLNSSNSPGDLVIAPDGNTVYAAVHVPRPSRDPGARIAAIDLTSCCPADVAGSPWTVMGKGHPKSLALSPDGGLLFMTVGSANTAAPMLFSFQVQQDGSLVPLGPGQQLFPVGATQDVAGILVL